MQTGFKDISDLNKGVLLSAALHLLLLLLFMWVRSGLDLGSEFAEIGFISAAPAAAKQPAKATTAAAQPAPKSETIAKPVAKPQTTIPQPKTKTQPAQPQKTPPVEVPKRRMLEEEKPQLTTAREREKPTPAGDAASEMRMPDAQHDAQAAQGSQPSTKTAESGVGDSGKSAAGEGIVGGSGTDKGAPYTIEGDAANRRIISQVLPAYPPGLQREAVVKIRFWVQPDGRIGQMIPVQKGDPQLEAITMQAMRQWRFNALPANVEPRNVQGIITFVYKLR